VEADAIRDELQADLKARLNAQDQEALRMAADDVDACGKRTMEDVPKVSRKALVALLSKHLRALANSLGRRMPKNPTATTDSRLTNLIAWVILLAS
jgi:hypothetical protein